jgi:hypothetical protein
MVVLKKVAGKSQHWYTHWQKCVTEEEHYFESNVQKIPPIWQIIIIFMI